MFDPLNFSRVRPRDNDEITRVPCRDGRSDFPLHLLGTDQRSSRHVTAAFGRSLIFELDSGYSRRLILPHRPNDVQCVAVSGVGVCNNRNRHRLHHTSRAVDHLAHRG